MSQRQPHLLEVVEGEGGRVKHFCDVHPCPSLTAPSKLATQRTQSSKATFERKIHLFSCSSEVRFNEQDKRPRSLWLGAIQSLTGLLLRL